MANSATSMIPRPISSPPWGRCSRAMWARRRRSEYVSPDGSLALPAFRVSHRGRRTMSAGAGRTLDSYGFVAASRRAGVRQQRIGGHHL